MSTEPRFRPEAPPAAAARAVLYELPALVGLGLVCGGVWWNWGWGWALIAAGTPLVLAYLLRETRFVWRRRTR